MKSYLEILKTVIQELQKSPHIELTRSDLSEGTDRDYIANVLSNGGYAASEAYLEFYSDVDYVDIEWVVKESAINQLSLENNMGASGRINISSFETVLSNLESDADWFNIAWREYVSVNHLTEERSLLPFDYFDPDISGCVCLAIADQTIGSDLYYFDHQLGTYALGMTVKDYFLALEKTRGIYGWQRALSSTATGYHKQVSFALAQLFS